MKEEREIFRFFYSDKQRRLISNQTGRNYCSTIFVSGKRQSFTEAVNTNIAPENLNDDTVFLGYGTYDGYIWNDPDWERHKTKEEKMSYYEDTLEWLERPKSKPTDCNMAVIPKEEILDAIYHCYQDKWYLLSTGGGKDDGSRNCALCQLMKRYDVLTSTLYSYEGKQHCKTTCVIAIDKGHCDNEGSLYKKYVRAASEYGVKSVQALHAADRFAYYLLDLYARVNQDKVKLPYLAVDSYRGPLERGVAKRMAEKHGPGSQFGLGKKKSSGNL